MSQLPAPSPQKTPGGYASKLPIPIRKTPGEASTTLRLPVRKTSGGAKTTTTKCPLPSHKVSGTNVPTLTASKEEQVNKAKSPSPRINRPTNDTVVRQVGRPGATLRKPASSTVRGTVEAATVAQRQTRFPTKPVGPKTGFPVEGKSTILASKPAAASAVPHVFTLLPSTYFSVKVCQGESFKPLPTRLQKSKGALHLRRYRHRNAPLPGTPQRQPKLTIPAGSKYHKKPLPGASPLKRCFLQEEVRDTAVAELRRKVVLGPKGRTRQWRSYHQFPLGPRVQVHRAYLGYGKRESPLGSFLRELKDGY